ncbi:MAG: hypothetical protein O3C27_09440 [Actinomycetota bacterium]|nr:hypothetical protein [Actinomycetota bacterium]
MVADVSIAEGSAQAFLDDDALARDPERPAVAVQRVQRPTLVLGSTQPADLVIDATSPERAQWDVIRRRSGGGLVVLQPSSGVWVDVFIPTSHRRWDPDVNQAFHWLGRAMAEALAPLLHPPSSAAPRVLSVHTGPLTGRSAGRLYCFAGLGPGEVMVSGPDGNDRKVVGISQRRTRAGARFQCFVALRHDPQRALPLISPGYREQMKDAMRSANAGWPHDSLIPDVARLEASVIDALVSAL